MTSSTTTEPLSDPQAPLETWVGNPLIAGITARSDRHLLCSHPDFEDFICMKHEDFACFYSAYVLNIPCEVKNAATKHPSGND
jgi:hypothetical protein